MNTPSDSIKRLIINRLFPETLSTPEELEKKYPLRPLKEGALVTRTGPSPTGFLHIGGLYSALISERLAHQSEGVFYLRIEDTDQARKVEGATELIIQFLNHYGIKPDEGPMLSGEEVGAYGPYTQSERASIYKTFVKVLLEKGLAYPCFCTPDELESIREQQKLRDMERFGYYGEWAIWRYKSDEEVLSALDQGKPFAIRFKAPSHLNRKVVVNDLLKGKRELLDNDQDLVILKSSGLPTYHFAHVVDDHLMRTTLVVRGDEWFPSLPIHLQLFQALGCQPPFFAHIAPIQKMEGSSKRKLSKRKDPEATLSYYGEQGYPRTAVVEYLLNLANSTFEDWRRANPDKDYHEFTLTLDRLANASGALFDFTKLNDTSKEIVARFSANEVFENGLNWAKQYDSDLARLMETHSDYVKQILSIERGATYKRARKDIAKWRDLKKEIEYFFDDLFLLTSSEALALLEGIDKQDMTLILQSFSETYDVEDSKEIWFDKIKAISIKYGYAENTKAFKANPSQYKGYVADVTKIFRVMLTGKTESPDLYAIMRVLGRERVLKRLTLVR
jgi:glutamyl-tRNA synthetase